MLRLAAAIAALAGTAAAFAAEVSYHKEVRPILQAKCWGCHQPAKPMGGFVMTEFPRLLKGGDTGAAVKPGDAKGSELLDQIALHDGKAAMPKNAPPLSQPEIETIAKWVKEGAKDDTPAAAHAAVDTAHPPKYSKPPVITALDWSPDGQLLAVAGFHEVLLAHPETGKLLGRLVGLSERIQGVAFSPDGKRLAAVGGNPGRMGEIQVWEVAAKKLLLSTTVGADTLFGGGWSPDGTMIVVGCPDNTVRAFDAKTGVQTLQQGAHADWPLDAAFSPDGKHIVSVGRDMTAKLTEFATQRFIDNITSITPGALKGGMQAVATHPQRDEIVVGGSDGVPSLFRMHRTSARVIGDNANLIKAYPALPGRIFGVAISRDGDRMAAASALDGAGEVMIASYPNHRDPKVEARIKALEAKRPKNRKKGEEAELAKLRAPKGGDEALRTKTPASAYAVSFNPEGSMLAVACGDGQVAILDATNGKIARAFSPAPVEKPAAAVVAAAPDYVRDVAPVLNRMGCSQGTCHGAAAGKNGFKLSLRGYDPVFDLRALTDDLASRRVNVASPDDSLMLLKATGAVPHAGGQLTKPGEQYYQLVRAWIAAGAKLDMKSARVAKIDLTPRNPTLQLPGEKQQFKVIATYADGKTRDVTNEAFVESGEPDVAVAAPRGGLLTAVRRGEAPTLARYEGAYAATTLTVMGDRTGFAWKQPETWGKVDELVAGKWQRLKIEPSGLCTDAEFLRRVHLDLTGLPPGSEDVRKFLADPRPTRVKRDEVVDQLVGSPEYVERWANKWADLLQVNGKFLGREGATAFRQWIKKELAANTPYDQFARKVLTAAGSNRTEPAASYFKILRDPAAAMENTTHLFLGVRFNCNKCHDHPFERWTQDQYYQTSAYFAQVGLKPDPEAKGKNIGGTAVEGAKPLYEIVADQSAGEVKHERGGAVVPPQFPYPAKFAADVKAPRRQQLAGWLTSPDNQYFAKSYANRLWGYLFGVGVIEPIDDIRAGNPPVNPELLDHLTAEFVKSGFDVRHLTKLICKSRTYQLAVSTNKWNQDDKRNFSHALPRRLEAETLYDTLVKAAGSQAAIPGVPPGTRAAALPDVGVELPSGFLGAFGRPVRESACECERVSSVQMGPVMALVNGGTLAEVLHAPGNALTKLAAEQKDDAKLIDELFVRMVGRPATANEIAACTPALAAPLADDRTLAALLAKREAEAKPIAAKREQDRLALIAATKLALAAREKEIAPAVAAAEKERQGRIAAAQAKLVAAEQSSGGVLGKRAAEAAATPWTTLTPVKATAAGGAKLVPQPDGSLYVEGVRKNGAYVLEFDNKRAGITAFRLEALSDKRLKMGGPGRAENGNFVLNQFTVEADGVRQPFAGAVASFSQDSYDIGGAADGQMNGGKGWAISPQFGMTHWAVFRTKAPIPAGKLVIRLQHNFSGDDHQLGRFRIAATTVKGPAPLGLAEEYAKAFAAPPAKRNKADAAALGKLAKLLDPEHQQLTQALAKESRPLPVDLMLQELRAALADAERPLREDPRLVQLRADAAAAAGQAKQARLTGVQDIAWALVNSPEFLFNH